MNAEKARATDNATSVSDKKVREVKSVMIEPFLRIIAGLGRDRIAESVYIGNEIISDDLF